MMNDLLLNQLILIKKTLEFYGDKNNYIVKMMGDSNISLDSGFMARNTIELIDKITEEYSNYENINIIEPSEDDLENEINNLIKALKKEYEN